MYDKREAAVTMFTARSNKLNLRDRRKLNQTTECLRGGAGVEDLKHFILRCAARGEERGQSTAPQQPSQEDDDELNGRLSFNKENLEGSKSL